jgi:predicted nuclease of predicted toxin-antitoxin system
MLETSACEGPTTQSFGTTLGRPTLIVSKDTEFREQSYLEGFPPKIIWLVVGNAGTGAIAQLRL